MCVFVRPPLPPTLVVYDPDRTILTLCLAPDSRNGELAQSGIGAIGSAQSTPANDTGLNTQARLEAILTFMEPGKEYTVDDICPVLHLKPTRTRTFVMELVRKGKLEVRGNTRSRRYVKPAS